MVLRAPADSIETAELVAASSARAAAGVRAAAAGHASSASEALAAGAERAASQEAWLEAVAVGAPAPRAEAAAADWLASRPAAALGASPHFEDVLEGRLPVLETPLLRRRRPTTPEASHASAALRSPAASSAAPADGHAQRDLRVVIAGGGVAGLSLALCMHHQGGARAKVLEAIYTYTYIHIYIYIYI